MRNADWINMDNRSEAWSAFKNWCKNKYGSSFADAYTAFFWLIDPEYCIVDKVDSDEHGDTEVDKESKAAKVVNTLVELSTTFKTGDDVEKEAIDILDEIITICSKHVSANGYSESMKTFEFCYNIIGLAATYRNRPVIECFKEVLALVYDMKKESDFNEHTEYGQIVLTVERKATKGFNLIMHPVMQPECVKLDSYIARIQAKCIERLTNENFEKNILLYKWASMVIYVIANSKSKKGDGSIFKKLMDISTDFLIDEKSFDNHPLADLAREVKKIAYDGQLHQNLYSDTKF